MPTPNDFSDVRFEPNRNTAGGDASPTADAPEAPTPAAGNYPRQADYGYDPAGNRQFSSDKDGDPLRLAEQTKISMSAFTDLQEYLNNSLETPGTRVCHERQKPWTPLSGAEGE